MDEHTCTHTLRVNDMMTVQLKIPVEVSLQELDNLLHMTRKTLNINTISHGGALKPQGRPPNNNSAPSTGSIAQRGNKKQRWTTEERKEIFDLWDENLSGEENKRRISKKLGKTHKQISGQYHTYKHLFKTQ